MNTVQQRKEKVASRICYCVGHVHDDNLSTYIQIHGRQYCEAVEFLRQNASKINTKSARKPEAKAGGDEDYEEMFLFDGVFIGLTSVYYKLDASDKSEVIDLFYEDRNSKVDGLIEKLNLPIPQ